jgi:hypothetical protein
LGLTAALFGTGGVPSVGSGRSSLKIIARTCDMAATVKKKAAAVPRLELSMMLPSNLLGALERKGALNLDGGQSFRAPGLS